VKSFNGHVCLCFEDSVARNLTLDLAKSSCFAESKATFNAAYQKKKVTAS